MQKLIILDSETGVCTIEYVPEHLDTFNDEDIESYVEGLGFRPSQCQWMIALEINDTTI